MTSDITELRLITASNIIKLRTGAGMTQAELGARLNYSDKTVSKWERGEAIPDAFVLTQLADIFGVSVDYLLSTETEWKAPEEEPAREERTYSVEVIILLTVFSIWTTALAIFVMLWVFEIMLPQVFLVALPISIMVYMILICAFHRTKYLMLVISSLVLSLLVMLYFFLPMKHPWQIFLLAVPSLIIIFLSFNIKKNPRYFLIRRNK